VKRFAKELESVKLTPPSIDDDSTILGMAAWFSVLCKVDDLVEDMDPVLARQVNAVAVMQALRTSLSDREEAESELLKESLKEVERMHAEAIDQAAKKWKEIHGCSSTGYEKELSDTIIIFMERHLKWSMACQRYDWGALI
jgi:hypothetical protein